jgi:predicted nucleic acid-binding protein
MHEQEIEMTDSTLVIPFDLKIEIEELCRKGRRSDLVQKFVDFPLGLSDSAVIACAERHGGTVATFDLRHLGVVARAGTIEMVP